MDESETLTFGTKDEVSAAQPQQEEGRGPGTLSTIYDYERHIGAEAVERILKTAGGWRKFSIRCRC